MPFVVCYLEVPMFRSLLEARSPVEASRSNRFPLLLPLLSFSLSSLFFLFDLRSPLELTKENAVVFATTSRRGETRLQARRHFRKPGTKSRGSVVENVKASGWFGGRMQLKLFYLRRLICLCCPDPPAGALPFVISLPPRADVSRNVRMTPFSLARVGDC